MKNSIFRYYIVVKKLKIWIIKLNKVLNLSRDSDYSAHKEKFDEGDRILAEKERKYQAFFKD